jgi:large subunit ribosomal protein L20
MARVKAGPYARRRRSKWLRQAKGYWGARHRQYRTARPAVMRAMISSYKERRRRKRTFRSLWILRLNAALRDYGLSYSQFIYGLKSCGVILNRKLLSELAIRNPQDFARLVELVKKREVDRPDS